MAKKSQSKPVEQEVEEIVTPEESTDPAPWIMPRPKKGQVVTFYRRGSQGERNAEIGFVSRVGLQSIDVVSRIEGFPDCYHVDDPRLKTNPDLRIEINGTWHFSEDTTLLEQRILEIEHRLSELEG